MNAVFWTAGSYAAGSIPTAYILGRWLAGIDIRTVGSGNIGATNVFRAVGPAAGTATLLIDAMKGFFPVWGALRFFPGEGPALAAGLAAVMGHSFSPFMGFKGGKGVATSAGVFSALLPGPMLCALGAFAAGLLAVRRVSVGSLLAAAALPASAYAARGADDRFWLAAGLALWVVVKHIPNMRRLCRGEEPAIKFFGSEKRNA